jgi:arginase
MLGVRDLDAAEKDCLDHSAVQLVKWHEGKPQGEVRAALNKLAQRVPEIYLHIDMDSLDPQVAPGVVFDPVPGGLFLEDMEEAIRTVFARFRVRAATLSVFNPQRDQDDKTLRAGLRIIEVLADAAGKKR